MNAVRYFRDELSIVRDTGRLDVTDNRRNALIKKGLINTVNRGWGRGRGYQLTEKAAEALSQIEEDPNDYQT